MHLQITVMQICIITNNTTAYFFQYLVGFLDGVACILGFTVCFLLCVITIEDCSVAWQSANWCI